MEKKRNDRDYLSALFNDKIILPIDVFDLVQRYIALNTSKQILPWTPDYIRDGEEEMFEYALQTYPQKVNSALNEIYIEINSRNLSENLSAELEQLLGEDLLAAQQVVLFNSRFTRSNV